MLKTFLDINYYLRSIRQILFDEEKFRGLGTITHLNYIKSKKLLYLPRFPGLRQKNWETLFLVFDSVLCVLSFKQKKVMWSSIDFAKICFENGKNFIEKAHIFICFGSYCPAKQTIFLENLTLRYFLKLKVISG